MALSLSDFLADGLKTEKIGLNKFLISILTFAPPLTIVIFKPGIFIKSLSYAGILCITLLALSPTAMAFSKRYIVKIPSNYEVYGGKFLLILNMCVALALILFGIKML